MAKSRELVLEIPIPIAGVDMVSAWDKFDPKCALDIGGLELQEYGTLGTPHPEKVMQPTTGSFTGCLSAHIFQKEGMATQLIAHFRDGSLRYSTDFLTSSTTVTWTSIATGLSTTAPFYFATFLDAVFMSNGVDDYRRWDGTTQTTYASAPKGKFLTVWKDVMWLGGVTGNLDRIYSSDPGDATTWPALNFVDIEKGRGFGVTGLAATDSALVVFKYFKHFIIYDPIEYTNRIVDGTKGAVTHYSIVDHLGDLYFVSHLGVCRYLGDAPAEIVSQRISTIFRHLENYGGTEDLMDWGETMLIRGYSYQDCVGWFLPGPAAIRAYDYYPTLPEKPWFHNNQLDFLFGLNVKEKNKPEELYGMTYYGDHVVRIYDQTFTTANSGQWLTCFFDFGMPTVEKYVYMIQVMFRGTLSSIRAYRDYDIGAGSVWAQTADIETPFVDDTEGEATVYCDFYCRSMALRIEVGTAGVELWHELAGGTGFLDTDVSRVGAGISKVIVHARALSDGYR